MEQLRMEMEKSPPVIGAYTPKKGELCAAKFVDGEWLVSSPEFLSPTAVYSNYASYISYSLKCTTPIY